MKKSRFYFLFLILALQTQFVWSLPVATDSVEIKKIKELVQHFRKQYAPDARSAIFSLQQDAQGAFYVETTDREAAQKFSSRISELNLLTKIALRTLPGKELGEQLHAITNVSVVNLRTNPNHAAEMATQTLLGTPLEVLKQKNGFYFVRTPEGYLAWVDAAGIARKTKSEINDWQQQEKLLFTSDFGHGYQKPDRQSDRISDLVLGNILVKIGEKGAYYQVLYPDQRTAYVLKSEMTPFSGWLQKTNPLAPNLIQTAKKMLGVPYLWGGTSIKGVDCSGFTKTIYYMNGLVIPRDASQQVLSGTEVSILQNGHFDLSLGLKNLKPGDLLFFASDKDKSPHARITHVGMYLGEGKFIHAAGKVRINSFNPNDSDFDDFNTRTLVAARQYLKSAKVMGITPLQSHPGYQIK
jgi:hypothetical protein